MSLTRNLLSFEMPSTHQEAIVNAGAELREEV